MDQSVLAELQGRAKSEHYSSRVGCNVPTYPDGIIPAEARWVIDVRDNHGHYFWYFSQQRPMILDDGTYQLTTLVGRAVEIGRRLNVIIEELPQPEPEKSRGLETDAVTGRSGVPLTDTVNPDQPPELPKVGFDPRVEATGIDIEEEAI